MTSKPLIGITSSLVRNRSGSLACQLGQAYTSAIQAAGGIPMIIPTGLGATDLPALLPLLDGVLLSGGGDIDPQHFQGNPHSRVYGVLPERDELEFALVKGALAAQKPLLAICRGIQVLNVAFGGSLYTHLADQRENSRKHDYFPGYMRDKLAHTVSFACGSRLHDIYGETDIRVNSLHHQGIQGVAEGLEAIGFAEDGLVEALEVNGAGFALGVQWHPECLPDDPGSQKLFRALIKAC